MPCGVKTGRRKFRVKFCDFKACLYGDLSFRCSNFDKIRLSEIGREKIKIKETKWR